MRTSIVYDNTLLIAVPCWPDAKPGVPPLNDTTAAKTRYILHSYDDSARTALACSVYGFGGNSKVLPDFPLQPITRKHRKSFHRRP